ncbi:MAG: hypothetical protein GY703_03660 [Gammaproteobacteria bacterium]|nr:hypothetical protein [Gammaproteobacteria bacterium]
MPKLYDVYDLKEWQSSDLYQTAKNLLYKEFYNTRNNLPFSGGAFDFEEWASYFALNDLFGTYHGTVPKSVKFYFNPALGKFQPLLFDAHKGAGAFDTFTLLDFSTKKDTAECEWICADRFFYEGFLANVDFMTAYISFMKKYSSDTFVDHVREIYRVYYSDLDDEFYAAFSPDDRIFSSGVSFYLFKFSEIENRAELIRQKVDISDDSDFIGMTEKDSISEAQKSGGLVLADDTVEFLEISDFRIRGSSWNFQKPTLILLSGEVELKGLSVETPLLIDGPVMLVQIGGHIEVENVEIRGGRIVEVKNRNWSAVLNVIDSKATIDNLIISDADAEDSLNLVSTEFEIGSLSMVGSRSDALDTDFSTGTIEHLSCRNIGNDCLDGSESEVRVVNLTGSFIGDKGVSAGENSHIYIDAVMFSDVGIGLVSKDGAILNVKNGSFSRVDVEVAAFIKKDEYDAPTLILTHAAISEQSGTALLHNPDSASLPASLYVEEQSSSNIEAMMYGAVYGKATEK